MSTNTAPLPVEGYYRWHSRIYDLTRWSFLFGRQHLIRSLAQVGTPTKLLEIGCGTGHNLLSLAKQFPAAQIIGIDVSTDMLSIANKKLQPHQSRVTLLNQAYTGSIAPGAYDLIICSYALSMFNPGWHPAIHSAITDLKPGGHFALVDFHDTAHPWFRRWMQQNHVEMHAHLLPELSAHLTPIQQKIIPAYGNLWSYLHFIGQKPQQSFPTPD